MIQLKGWDHNRPMSNFSPFFDFACICPIFCSSWFRKHFMVLQSWTKLLEKTKHEQYKNHLLTISLLLILPQNYTSLSHPLPVCNDNRTQTTKKPLTYCFSLLNSAVVTSPSPLLLLMQCWCGKWCLPGNCLWPRKQHWVRGGGGEECDGLLVYR